MDEKKWSINDYYCKQIDDASNCALSAELMRVVCEYLKPEKQGVNEIGSKIDVRSNRLKYVWSVAEVVEVAEEFGQSRSRVHFIGWPDQADEWIYWSTSSQYAPLFTHTRSLNSLEVLESPVISEDRDRNLQLKDLERYGFNSQQAIYLLSCFSTEAYDIASAHAINAMLIWAMLGKQALPSDVQQACKNALSSSTESPYDVDVSNLFSPKLSSSKFKLARKYEGSPFTLRKTPEAWILLPE
jgi:hypothetical protein